MRLKKDEILYIKETFEEVFGDGKIYLFGSKVDDGLKGGDIDLYIKTKNSDAIDKKIKFLATLKQKIGDQKIDIVLSKYNNKIIEQEVLQKGIEL